MEYSAARGYQNGNLTLSQLLQLLAFAEVLPLSQDVQAQDVIPRYTLVALDGELSPFVLQGEVLSDSPRPISKEWVRVHHLRVLSQDVVEQVVERHLGEYAEYQLGDVTGMQGRSSSI